VLSLYKIKVGVAGEDTQHAGKFNPRFDEADVNGYTV